MKDRAVSPQAIDPSSGGVTPVTSQVRTAGESTAHIIENANGSDSHTSRVVSVIMLKTAERDTVHLCEQIHDKASGCGATD